MSIGALKSPLCSPSPTGDFASQYFPSSSNSSSLSVSTNGAIGSNFCSHTGCNCGSLARQSVFPSKGITCVQLINKSYGNHTKDRIRRRRYEVGAQANAEGDNIAGSADTEEGPTQATVEQGKRILEIQKDLLGQIVERKKLLTALKENLGNPVEKIKAYNDANKPTKEEATIRAEESRSHHSLGLRNLSKPLSSNVSMPTDSRLPTDAASQPDTSKHMKSLNQERMGKYGSSRTPSNDYVPPRLPRTPTVPFPAPDVLRPERESKVRQEAVEEQIEIKESLEKSETEAAVGITEEKPPPLAGPNVMNIIVVAAECAPWSKTGGLGDVAGALPKALARRGHRVMVVAPRYGQYQNVWETGVWKRYNVAGQDMEVGYFHGYIDGVDYVFVGNSVFHGFANNIYGGNREDVLKRMVLLCKAAVEIPWHVPCGGVCYGDGNLVFIANDWHTALLPVYLQAYYRDHGMMSFTRSILVIHNMAHQGRGPLSDFALLGLPDHYIENFRLYDPIGGEHMNIFKAGLLTAHRVVAVSHGYAWECQTQEGGWGLDGLIRDQNWKLRGIVNGIDDKEWNPELDVHLKRDGYENYSLDTLESGKAACKTALQKELGLPARIDVPMLGFIGRLDHQKGVDIIADAMHWMMDQDLQLVMLGSGRADLENMLRSFEGQHREKVRGWVGFSVQMAHRITAGCDILLMPSRFEPCGLNQLYAMRYGTVPVVHAVGGLRDTVQAFDPFSNSGTGWTFHKADASAMIHALGNAMWTYQDFKDSWRAIQKRGISQDLSWDNAAKQYEEVLLAAKYQW